LAPTGRPCTIRGIAKSAAPPIAPEITESALRRGISDGDDDDRVHGPSIMMTSAAAAHMTVAMTVSALYQHDSVAAVGG